MFYRDNEYSYNVGNMLSSFMYKVYAWMAAALVCTAASSYGLYAHQELFMWIVSTKAIFYSLLFGQVGLVILLSALKKHLSFHLCTLLFFLYSACVGVTCSVIFSIFVLDSIASIFAITAGMFAVMALYGYFTKADLTGIGNILIMGLFGMIIASVANWFIGSESLHYVLSGIGVIIFTGLTAYDVQQIKRTGQELIERGESDNKAALFGALSLYLNFINLFLRLLQLFGKRK